MLGRVGLVRVHRRRTVAGTADREPQETDDRGDEEPVQQ